MEVAVHNPSSLDLQVSRIAVPNGNYTVYGFNTTTQQFEETQGSLACNMDHDENNTAIHSCFLSVAWPTAAYDISLIKLHKEDTSEPGFKTISLEDRIQRGDITVSFEAFSTDFLKFKISDSLTGSEEHLVFSLKWWASFIDYYMWDNAQNSGDYIFRPMAGQYVPNVYSEYNHGTISNAQMDFYFQKQDANNSPYEVAIVHLTIDPELGVLKFDVDLDSLPTLQYDGYEVIVDFQVENFDNNQTFYTDSNGLEMQQRRLNYRPTWDIQANYNDSNENVTANYYPINTAITMRDNNRQFTVCNDRPQSGSALSKGAIQFMQNRRIPADDRRGMGEYVNELNSVGNGIRVPASYYVQVFDTTKRQSAQRYVQLKTDNPAMMFFNFNLKQISTGVKSNLSSQLKQFGIQGLVKIVMMPINKNSILVRLENIADLYDAGSATQYVNLLLITALFADQNKGAQCSFEFMEMSLSANMSLDELLKRKIHWKTVDDDSRPDLKKSKLDYSVNQSMISLEPQRIRVFEISVTSATSENFLQ